MTSRTPVNERTAPAKNAHRRGPAALVWRMVSTLALLAVVGLAAIMLLPAALGYQRYVITTGSMRGTLNPGTLVYDKVVPVKDVRVGDIITYAPPPNSGYPHSLVTHRVHWIGRDPATGREAFQTKGDANNVPDQWHFVPTSNHISRVAFHVPYVGYAWAFLLSSQGHWLVFGIPALLIALSVIAQLWRDAGEEMARERRESTPDLGAATPEAT